MNTQTLYPVTIDGINYLIDKDVEIKENDKYFDIDFSDKLIGIAHQSFKGNKVVAVEYPHKIEGLYQYKLPDESQTLAEERIPHSNDNEALFQVRKSDFIAGYKANKALYTEKDLEGAFAKGIVTQSYNLPIEQTYIEYKQSLHKKKIESIEVSMTDFCDYEGEELWEILPDWRYDADKDGLLIISKINYKCT